MNLNRVNCTWRAVLTALARNSRDSRVLFEVLMSVFVLYVGGFKVDSLSGRPIRATAKVQKRQC